VQRDDQGREVWGVQGMGACRVHGQVHVCMWHDVQGAVCMCAQVRRGQEGLR